MPQQSVRSPTTSTAQEAQATPPELATQPYGNAAAAERLMGMDLGGVIVDELDRRLFPDTVYVGANTSVVEGETAALPAWAAVCDGSEKRGTVKSTDGKTDLALEKPEDVAKFLDDAGVSKARAKADGSTESQEEVEARMAALQKVMMGSGVGSRDLLAELIQTTQKVENGELEMEKMVISGHHLTGDSHIYGGDNQLHYEHLKGIMEQFPEARAGVKDLMLSSCNTIKGGKHDEQYQAIFPNLETTWGYDGKAPSLGPDEKNSSAAHIALWDAAARGDDPNAVVDAAKGRTNAKVATY